MVCIYCGSPTRVVNSRQQRRSGGVWRRRKCLKCQAVITSVEAVDLSSSVVVQNARGNVEPFSRDKLLISLYDSLKHRKTASRDATSLTDTVWIGLVRHIGNGSIDTSAIKQQASSVLDKFDRAAATSYRAYHPL